MIDAFTDLDKPTETLSKMACAISSGPISQREAMEFLELAYRIGNLTGRKNAYAAEKRADEARLADLRSKREERLNG